MVKETILVLFFLATVGGCASLSSNKTWTVQETKEWYRKHYVDQPDGARPFIYPLYYRGSNDTHHFFAARSMDDWVFIKIKVEDLTLIDVRPKWELVQHSNSIDSSGYYAVDPLHDFKKISQGK